MVSGRFLCGDEAREAFRAQGVQLFAEFRLEIPIAPNAHIRDGAAFAIFCRRHRFEVSAGDAVHFAHALRIAFIQRLDSGQGSDRCEDIFEAFLGQRPQRRLRFEAAGIDGAIGFDCDFRPCFANLEEILRA